MFTVNNCVYLTPLLLYTLKYTSRDRRTSARHGHRSVSDFERTRRQSVAAAPVTSCILPEELRVSDVPFCTSFHRSPVCVIDDRGFRAIINFGVGLRGRARGHPRQVRLERDRGRSKRMARELWPDNWVAGNKMWLAPTFITGRRSSHGRSCRCARRYTALSVSFML